MHRGLELWGEVQELLHTGKDLPVCRNVITPMMAWAEARDYDVRRQNGNEEIKGLDGSRWIVRGKGSVYGYSGTYGLVDECWGVAPEVVDDGILQTMLERRSPQLLMTSTAHRKATTLMPARRLLALAELVEPRLTLLLEWSAPRDVSLDDEIGWRLASPHWGRTRDEIIQDSWRRIQAGESLDDDEDDPAESFRAQILNIWPLRGAVRQLGEPLFLGPEWDAAQAEDDAVGPLAVAVDDWMGHGAAVAAAGVSGGGRVVVGGWSFPRREEAYPWCQTLLEGRPGSVLLVGVTLAEDLEVQGFPFDVERRGSTDSRSALPLLRELVATKRLVHNGAEVVRQAVTTARVTPAPSGGLSLVNAGRLDLVRAVAWAAAEAHRTAGLAPAVL